MEKRIACLKCREHKSVSRKRALLLRPPKNPINITREIKSENEFTLSIYDEISVLLDSKIEREGKTALRIILKQ